MTAGGPYKIGQKFGPYTLESYLGAGAFKSIYRAVNQGSVTANPVVALGFPHQQDPDGIAELENEFAVSRQLIHPNILRVYGVERQEGVTFLVMEYLEGRTLAAIIREKKVLPVDEAVRYTALSAEALAYAHEAHVFHRDVKPANIFITSKQAVKLMDFGIARLLAARTDYMASTRIGTVEYMAPELFQGAAGTNADIWALGVTFYEMITGSRPFSGEVGEVIQKIMTGRYEEKSLQEKQVETRIIRVLRKMLSKDTERRYQKAEELIRDLEAIARRTRLMDSDESRLEVLIRASFPLIYVLSYEEDRVVEAVRRIALRLTEDTRRPRNIFLWSASRGLRDDRDQLISPDSLEDPTVALNQVIESPGEGLYLFLDMHRHFTPVVTRLIRDAARAVRLSRKALLFLSPSFQVPEELEKEVNLVVFHLPDREQIEPLIDQLMERCRMEGLPVDLGTAEKEAIIQAASGLTLNEVDRAVNLAAQRNGGLLSGVERKIIEEKTQIIRKTGILEYFHSSESFREIGGLEKLIAWFGARAQVFSGTFRYPGLPQPKGVLLVGVPGCGKSLSAKALAGAWGVPLLRLDVGRIFGSLVGSSEANLRQAIQTAEAVSPCILWIDEVEKGFAGVQGQSGGGVSARIFGNFLTWLQDKRSPVFVVATANDLSGIPPEFLRKGRFDEVFFVGLPDKSQRERIFSIHLSKHYRDATQFDLTALAEKSDLFSGAEIEQSVISGLFRAFEENREVRTEDISQAAKETFPLARSRSREIAMLTNWAEQNARWAD
jgi:serine/threonine protein kinase/SpoVK/Ycf46/Vps4 family AAA+-type ATPase